MKSAGTIQKNTEKRASHDVLFSLCENAADKLILLVLLGSVLLFILWPIACIALRSLRGADGGVSFAMFGTVLRQYGESLRNSVFVGVFTAVLSTILSLSAALVCATARGWKKALCMIIMLVAMVSPPFVSSLAYIQLYGRRGWISYRLLHLSLNPYNRWGASKRIWGPIMVHSSTASPSSLPTRMLAMDALRGSITPETDTPNCW